MIMHRKCTKARIAMSTGQRSLFLTVILDHRFQFGGSNPFQPTKRKLEIAKTVFSNLKKKLFISANILKMSGPTLQFVVIKDALEVCKLTFLHLLLSEADGGRT